MDKVCPIPLSEVAATPLAAAVRRIVCLSFVLLFASAATASSIAGKVINRSRNQVSGGDEVVLYGVDQSMHELARTKSSPDGTFQFQSRGNARYLIAVFHENISYHSGVLRENGPVEISVYDTTISSKAVQEDGNTLFLENDHGALKATEFSRW